MMQISEGSTGIVLDVTPNEAGVSTKDFYFAVDDTVLLSLFVRSVTSGTLSVRMDLVRPDYTKTLIEFPTITGPAAEIMIKEASPATANLRVTATYTGPCNFVVTARGVPSTSGTVKTTSAGITAAAAKKFVVGTAPTEIISQVPVRASVLITNNSSSAILYVGFSQEELTSGNGYPVQPGTGIELTVASGLTVFAASSESNTDVRTLHGGS